MQTWAKRGIQTALVTGGLLMLGTGIASADEKVDPDTPAGPLDVEASFPVEIDDNAVGIPGQQVDLPSHHNEISTKPVTDPIDMAAPPAREAMAPITDPVASAAAPVHGAATIAGDAGSRIGSAARALVPVQHAAVDPPAARPAEPTSDPLLGNKVTGDVMMPIQITGNAFGALGDAETRSVEEQNHGHHTDVTTSGAGSAFAGNVVALDWSAPVQISGNAGGVLGNGATSGSATQSAATTGDVETAGKNGALSGNALTPQFSTPVQLSGNAVSGPLGHATSDFAAESVAESGGYVLSDGEQGAGAGNVAAAPLSLPLRAAGNGITGIGGAEANGTATAVAESGGTKPGRYDIPSYVSTSGKHGLASGNVAQPQGALLGSVTGSAAAVAGNAFTGTGAARQGSGITSSAESSTGGFSNTSGHGGTGSGNIADAPFALPVETFGVGGGVFGSGIAENHGNNTAAHAGGGTVSHGDDSLLSANTASGQAASTLDAFGSGAGVFGTGRGSAKEQQSVVAGGHSDTSGNNSALSGNVGQVPLSAPAALFGLSGSAVGKSSGIAEETTAAKAGGGGNTHDDFGVVASNFVGAPVSAPAQVFGVGTSAVGKSFGAADSDTISEAGGDVYANGKKGAASGNAGLVPVSLPTQVHGVAGNWVGYAAGVSDNATRSAAGGNTRTTGEGGALAGNTADVPFGSSAGAGGIAANWVGTAAGTANNDMSSKAGGNTGTRGDRGALAGNVVSAETMPIAAAYGGAASLTGIAHGRGDNATDIISGGRTATSGSGGVLSGDIFDTPASVAAEAFGATAAAAGGEARAVAKNNTTATASRPTTTKGNRHELSGVDGQQPVAAMARTYRLPITVLGRSMSYTGDRGKVLVADKEPQIQLPKYIAELPVDELPSLFGAVAPFERPARHAAPELPTEILPKIYTRPVEMLPGRSHLPRSAAPLRGGRSHVTGVLPATARTLAHYDTAAHGRFQGVLDGLELDEVAGR
ncbi:hypothetical protein BAY61_31545 [Prauserella marina]|uniref:Uncharacterized protein n=1 Tax=Prauserella marina TaxID=530584 RepID=A0A222VXT5_9PSEU|nr:hypothetical protein [Prauserella marina]ASR38786.1 hypothetical protein BAY61_31545 [Prauserella marina]PWV82145.1 hypothetical protein DES30_102381 [Prauserella marina]SDD20312.1 hypothetical protein SAMN05421630_106381 [Prauserella marina]